MKKENIKLDGEKWFNNPRFITEERFDNLKENLELLGDLSGVVYDLNSGMFVSGNQRSEVFQSADIEIVERYEQPTKAGTVAIGFILWNGEKYNYRQVKWNLEQCRRAVITANSLGGSWDKDILANSWDDLPLEDWGVPVPFEYNPEEQEESNTDSDSENLTGKKNKVTLEYTDDDFIKIKEALRGKSETPEQIFAKALGVDFVF